MQVTELYDEKYYATSCGPLRYERSAHWLNFFSQIAEHLIRALHPTRVFDAGCALGFLVEAFWDRGIYAEGVDISEYAISQVRGDMGNYCKIQSLTGPITGQFDLVTCIEVLEHIDPADTRTVIANLCHVADAILFSSSPSEFSEPTHVNIQPAKFWLDLFAEHGFGPDISFDADFVTPHAFLVRKGLGSEQSILQFFAQHLRLKTMLRSNVTTKASDEPFEVQVFPFGKSGYSGHVYVSKAIIPNSWQTVSLSLSAADAMPLRVDPGNQISVIQITGITIFDELSRAVLWSPTVSQDFDTVRVAGTAIRLDSTDSGITVLSYGSDPQILLPAFSISGVETLTLDLTLRIETKPNNDTLGTLLKRQEAVIIELRDRQKHLIVEHEVGLQHIRADSKLHVSALEVETEKQVSNLITDHNGQVYQLDLKPQEHFRQVQHLEQEIAQSRIGLVQMPTIYRNASDERISALIAEHSRQIRELNLELQARCRQLQNLEQEIAQSQIDLAELRTICETANAEVKIKKEALEQARDQLRSFSDKAAQSRYELGIARQHMTELERLRSEAADLQQQVSELRGTLNNMLTSVSWRITKPARNFMFALRGGGRQSK